MFVAANRFTAIDGKGEKLIQEFAETAEGIGNEPGFIRFDFLAPPADGDTYIAQTYWESRANFEAWTESEHFRDAHDDHSAETLITEPPSLEIYQAVQSL